MYNKIKVILVIISIVTIAVILSTALLSGRINNQEIPTVSKEYKSPVIVDQVTIPQTLTIQENNNTPSKLQTIIDFLALDNTNKQENTIYHRCSDFSNELRANASKQNIEIYSLIVWNEDQIGHTLNFIIVDNTFYIIEPQNDEIVTLEEYKTAGGYRYLKMYTSYNNVPTRTQQPRKAHIDLENYSMEEILNNFK